MTGKGRDLHAKLVKDLEEKVRGSYKITMTEVEVRDPLTGNVVGEIDLVGIIDGNWDLYEVKVNDGFSKAKRQLYNLKQHLSDCGEIGLYYYSGRENKVVKIE